MRRALCTQGFRCSTCTCTERNVDLTVGISCKIRSTEPSYSWSYRGVVVASRSPTSHANFQARGALGQTEVREDEIAWRAAGKLDVDDRHCRRPEIPLSLHRHEQRRAVQQDLYQETSSADLSTDPVEIQLRLLSKQSDRQKMVCTSALDSTTDGLALGLDQNKLADSLCL
jgi:hypothetical protein